jgi:putative ABC transport system ATP-binding protein
MTSDRSGILIANKLQKEYQLGEHVVRALKGVDFLVEPGEFVAIMGPSGSGKSTLLHLLGGLDKPTSGDIELAGESLSLLGEKEATLARRHNIGFVFQFYNLLPTLTAEENILLPILIDGKDVKAYEADLTAILDLVGLAGRRHHKPDQLSGGEQQRVSLARALITRPAIVLADEPTGNLDSKTGTTIMQLLRRSCDELGQTIIVVTHDQRAAAFADRVVFLHDGQIGSQVCFQPEDSSARRRQMIVEIMTVLEV